MTPEQYAKEVKRTMGPTCTVESAELGLLGEAGEVCDLVKKSLERRELLHNGKMVEELGDVLWYLMALTLKYPKLQLSMEKWNQPSPISSIDYTLSFHCVELVQRCSGLVSDCYGKLTLSVVLVEVDALLGMIGSNRSECMERNVEKLRKRYPDGFSAAASKARADEEKEPGCDHRWESIFRTDEEAEEWKGLYERCARCGEETW